MYEQVTKLHDRFDWDKETQGLILGSFFLGYVLTQLPGGWLASKYGGKKLYGWCMFVCAMATLLTPLAARTSVVMLIVMRAIAGVCQVHSFFFYYVKCQHMFVCLLKKSEHICM